MITDWLNEILVFPADYEFIRYLLLSVIIVISVALAYGFFAGTFSAIFKR